ncbi:MAG: molybdopterin-dependent oxidoreductase [Acidobacteria bacterium]|nr:molybdopterin-dependent oxidoreductase [Acidobacteriota bacterium]
MSWDDDNELVVDGPTTFPVDRRDFLKLTSTGLLVLMAVDPAQGLQEGARPQAGRQGPPTDVNAYLHIGTDNRVTCFVGKVELGQGSMTSLPQLLAEELDVPLASVDVVMGDTDVCPWDMGTFGSLSIRTFGPILRNAGAEARAVLLLLASERLQVPIDTLVVKAGVVSVATDANKKVTYGQLTEGKRIERKLEQKATVKPVKAFRIVGMPAPRRDAIEKVTGKAKYAGDIVPPGGALHARILRPPAHGATMTQVDTSAAEQVPGVRVIRDGDMVAVLHEHRDEADRALALIKAQFTRNDPPVDNQTIFDHLVKNAPQGQRAAAGGDVATFAGATAQKFDATYLDSYMAHAPMETHSAVAAVENGKVTVWAGTQTPFPVKSQIMAALRLPADKVRVITPFVGGGFGGKSASRQAVEAARLAVLTGKPVRVVFGRDEEFFYDTFRPAAVMKIKSAIDASGAIVLWDYHVYAAGERGAAHFYNIANHQTMVYGSWGGGGAAGYHPFAIGPWRAPGASTNAFARESHIDVMAARAGMDPVAFRLKNLTDPRMIRALEAAAKRFGWTPKAAPSGRGVGVACGIDAGTYVTLMTEVAVDKATGRVQVKRVVCAQDQGVIVNREGSVQQVEGCITMGLGYTFSEEIHFKGGEVLDKNFDTYGLPLFSWVPRIETVLIDAPEIPAAGCGEPAIVPVGAAVANAIFDAVGARLNQLPMTPARVKQAIGRS